MNINFSKYQATGNDFVLINGFKAYISLTKEQIAEVCDRHFGIGADGLIIARSTEDADVFMDYYNCDGSIAEMCGNGVRALSAFSKDENIENARSLKSINVQTRAGLKAVRIEDDIYSVNMGPASFDNESLGFASNEAMWKYPLEINSQVIEIYGASMGNPHCIIFTDDIDNAPVNELGPLIEHNELFKNRINVEWVEVQDELNMKVKVWERGVGYTLACGTGVCASFAIANRLNFVKNKANVSLPGGNLKVELQDKDLLLSGQAKKVFSGDIEI